MLAKVLFFAFALSALVDADQKSLSRLRSKSKAKAHSKAHSKAHAKLVTSCETFSTENSYGSIDCERCTQLTYQIVQGSSDFITIRDDNGGRLTDRGMQPSSVFLKRPDQTVNAPVGNGVKNCVWCPETQTCGPDPEDDPARQCPKGWLRFSNCEDTRDGTTNRYLGQERILEPLLANYSPEKDRPQVIEFVRERQSISSLSVITSTRETDSLHGRDSLRECLGECLAGGNTACSSSVVRKFRPEGEDLTCSFVVPAGPNKFRAFGQYDAASWKQCVLVPCSTDYTDEGSPAAKGTETDDKKAPSTNAGGAGTVSGPVAGAGTTPLSGAVGSSTPAKSATSVTSLFKKP